MTERENRRADDVTVGRITAAADVVRRKNLFGAFRNVLRAMSTIRDANHARRLGVATSQPDEICVEVSKRA